MKKREDMCFYLSLKTLEFSFITSFLALFLDDRGCGLCLFLISESLSKAKYYCLNCYSGCRGGDLEKKQVDGTG